MRMKSFTSYNFLSHLKFIPNLSLFTSLILSLFLHFFLCRCMLISQPQRDLPIKDCKHGYRIQYSLIERSTTHNSTKSSRFFSEQKNFSTCPLSFEIIEPSTDKVLLSGQTAILTCSIFSFYPFYNILLSC